MLSTGAKSTTSAYYILVIASFLAIFCLNCGNKSTGGKGYFRYNETSGIASLDPAFAKNQSIMWAAHQLFNTLVEVDSTLQLKPSLATRWEISPDGRTYTFSLRNDVFFHDHPVFPGGKGRKMTADDVVFSLQRIVDPTTASSGAWIFNNKIDTIHPFTALNDTTFQLKLLQPFRPMLGILSMQYCSVVPKEIVQHYGRDFRRNPVGTGPFSFGFWEEGQALVLRKHPRYFERDEAGSQLPYLDGVQVSFLDNKAAEFLEFRQQRLHFINDIESSFKDEVLTKAGSLRQAWQGKIKLHRHPYLNIEYLGIFQDTTTGNNPLRQKKVRQAINYAFDREKMMLYLRNSIGTAAHAGFVPMGLPSFDARLVKGYSYDPKMARKLLEEAGYGNGKQMPAIKLLTIPIYTDLAAFIATELGEAGIPVQVETVQKSLLLEMTANGRAPFFRGSWIADYPDAENYLSVFYGKNPAPPNYTRFRNARYDALFEKAVGENNDSLRYELYREMDRIIVEEAPVVPLWYDMVLHLVQPGVKGFQPNALNLLELRRCTLDQ